MRMASRYGSSPSGVAPMPGSGLRVRLVLVGQEVAQALQRRVDVLVDRRATRSRLVIGDVRHRRRPGTGRSAWRPARSICSICLRTGMAAPVRPSAMPSRSVSMYCSIAVGKAAKRASSFSSPSGVSAIWYWATITGMRLRARDVVDRQLVLLLLQRLELVARDQDQHVAGDDLLRLEPSAGIDRFASASIARIRGLVRRAPSAPRSGRRSSKRSSPRIVA